METAQETAQKKAEMELARQALLLERQVQRDQKEVKGEGRREVIQYLRNNKTGRNKNDFNVKMRRWLRTRRFGEGGRGYCGLY